MMGSHQLSTGEDSTHRGLECFTLTDEIEVTILVESNVNFVCLGPHVRGRVGEKMAALEIIHEK